MITRPHVFIAMLFGTVGLLPLRLDAQSSASGASTAQAASSSSAAPQTPRASGAFDPIDTRIVSDPLYLPQKGQIYGMTAYTWNRPSGDNFKNGVNTGSFTASDNATDQTVAYGLLNDVSLHVAFGYGANQRDSTAATTGDVTTGNSSGYNDPTIGATYRVLDEPTSPLILDVTASYSPDAFASKTAGGGSDGTLGRGGQTSGVSMALGREMTSFTVAGTAAATYVGAQTTALLSNGTSTDSASHWSYSAGLTTQTRVSDRVSVNAGVAFASAGAYGVSNLDSGNSHTYNPAVTRAVDLALNYHLVPNRLVAAVTYTYNNYTDATNTFAKATSDTAVQHHTANVVGVRLMYVF